MSEHSPAPVDAFRQPDLQTMRSVGDEVPLGNHPVLDHVMWCAQHFGFGMAEFGGEALDDYGVYTIGLSQYAHPDFIIFGVPPEGARLVLSALGRLVVHEGRVFPAQSQLHRVHAASNRLEGKPLSVRVGPLKLQDEQRLTAGRTLLRASPHPDLDQLKLLRVTFDDPADPYPMPFAHTALSDPRGRPGRSFRKRS